ncbi:MAG: hypothetical protein KJ676_10010 [Alphaproteobacteria bacterium]|nr:hypothetical protein [Alphaproteobacteria bacterium]MBU1527445.1 hypothetical protein [Alphaproteobacteria bacterium]MBU2116677.1 hypothetical protein [Alphaproteobacteria bacterium]MBU2352685.1 hypothetical protein [Alphaproteobacteria bacterium]
MSRVLILSLALTSAACTWPREITPTPNETAQQRVERADRQAEQDRRCQAAANRNADRDYDRDMPACPRN